MNLNNSLVQWFNGIAQSSVALERTTVWIADRMDVWIIVLLLLWFLYRAWQRMHRQHRLFCFSCFHEVAMVAFTGVSAWGIAHLSKALIGTARPFLVPELMIQPLFMFGGFDAFPSGHSALFMALALVTFFHDRVVGAVLFACAFLIGVTRVMAGVHFPLDIIGGYIIGMLVVFIIMLLDRKHLHFSRQ